MLTISLGPTHLHGTTDYGDAVDDEWLITYILVELTKKLPETWVRIADTDGEFLLIEAAGATPSWLSPDNDEFRVWINNGMLYTIPPDDANGSQKITLLEALKFLNGEVSNLIHNPALESEAFFRLRNYPLQIERSIHYSLATIPRTLALLLHENASLVPGAVECFYLRDASSLEMMQGSASRNLFPPEDLVTISVRFSRILFAQIQSQQFSVPPKWKTAWIVDDTKHPPRYTSLELGMKLTIGFELLCSLPVSQRPPVAEDLDGIIASFKDLKADNLPSDDAISSWPNVHRQDDENWLNINFDDLQRELDGKSASNPSTAPATGFGDSKTQEDIQKIVARFESFMNDTSAGIDGIQVDATSTSYSEDYTSSDEQSGDETDIGFNETVFSQTLQHILDNPQLEGNPNQARGANSAPADLDEDASTLSYKMEAELRSHGALRLGASHLGHRPATSRGANAELEDGHQSDGDVDIDINLAYNILQSFKNQGGSSGPTSSLLGLMGVKLPKDEDSQEE